jgi:hypothetical protein
LPNRASGGSGGEEILPILQEDSYFPLLPGEKRQVSVTYRDEDLQGSQPVIEVAGWNVAPRSR